MDQHKSQSKPTKTGLKVRTNIKAGTYPRDMRNDGMQPKGVQGDLELFG